MNKILIFGLCICLLFLSGCSDDDSFTIVKSTNISTVSNVTNNYFTNINYTSSQCADIEDKVVNVTIRNNTLELRCEDDIIGGSDIGLSSVQCSGTDKLFNVSFNGTAISGVCATDQSGSSSIASYQKYSCFRNNTLCDGNIGSSAKTVATAFTINVLRCFPYVTGRGYSIDQLGMIVATANSTQIVKLALYNDSGLSYPASLIANTSTINLNATGFKYQDIAPVRLNNDSLYWICSATNITTAGRVNVVALADYPEILGLSSSTASNIGYTVAYTYTNALPNPYTAGATYVTAIYPSAYTRVRTDI